MKEYFKLFTNVKNAHGYEILCSPFLCTIGGENEDDSNFNFIGNENKCLSYNGNTLIPINKNELQPYFITLPDGVLKFMYGNRYVYYDRTFIYNTGLYPEYNAVFEQDSYTPIDYVTLHIFHEDGTEEIETNFVFTVSWLTPNGDYIPHTMGFLVELNIPDRYIPGGWNAKSNIIYPYYPDNHDYWKSHSKD